MTTEHDARGRTDPHFWDTQWGERRRGRFRQWLLHDRESGRQGTVFRLVRQHVGETALRGSRVVEIGGAESRILVGLARWGGCHVTAVDYSPVGVEKTEGLFREAAVTGTVVLADVFDWHDGDGTFDVVTHWGVLEHFDDPKPMLAASARLAKVNGVVIFSMPNLESSTAKLWHQFAPVNFSAHVCHSDDTIRRACDEVGLVIERQFRAGPPLMRIAPPERGSAPARLALNAMHVLSRVASRLLPAGLHLTPRSLASQRYFVARRCA